MKLPKPLIKIISQLILYKNIFIEFFHDARKYIKYSTSVHLPKKEQELEARIMAHYHVIEKGLAFRDARLEFGQDIIFSLINLLKNWEKNNYPGDNFAYLTAISTLKQYINWHKENNIDLIKIKSAMGDLLNKKDNNSGGAIKISKEKIDEDRKKEFATFFKSRHSIRDFKVGAVPIEEIKKSIELAQHSPSACNRQSVKTYIIQDKKIQEKILKIQGGNRGFGHLADKLLIITSDLSYFDGVKEKNLNFIDGGIYTMSLIFSLHYYGIDSCPLSWPADYKKDKELKKITNINNSENVILILAIGCMEDNIKITKSTRKPIKDIKIL